MSFYATLCLPDRVEVITDGAHWSADGVVRGFSRKVDVVKTVPAAITTRGDVAIAEAVTKSVMTIFERAGSYDVAMAVLATLVPQIEERLGVGFDRHIEMAICGISESEGPITHHWATRRIEGVEELVLHSTARGVMCGHEHSVDHHGKLETAGGFQAKDFGKHLVDHFRRQSDPSVEAFAGVNRLPIGGHVDLTTVTATGVRTERIHTYTEDRVGEVIDPYANDPSVALFGNRAERRRMAKQGRAA